MTSIANCEEQYERSAWKKEFISPRSKPIAEGGLIGAEGHSSKRPRFSGVGDNPKAEMPETEHFNKEDREVKRLKHNLESLREKYKYKIQKHQDEKSKQEGEIATLNEKAARDKRKIKDLQDEISKEEGRKVQNEEDPLEKLIELIASKDREIKKFVKKLRTKDDAIKKG